jgi:hypothetical protein
MATDGQRRRPARVDRVATDPQRSAGEQVAGWFERIGTLAELQQARDAPGPKAEAADQQRDP